MSKKVVILPGLPGRNDLYQKVPPLLRGYDVQIIEYPQQDDQSYASLAQSILPAINFDSFHVVGESYGGPVGLCLADLVPDRVKSLTLSTSFVSRLLPAYIQYMPLELFIPLGIREYFIRTFLLNESATDTDVQTVINSLKSTAVHTLAVRLRNIANIPDNFPPSLSCPLLYVYGTRDKLVPVKCIDDARDKFPSVKVVNIGGPHLLFMARPQELARELLQFLSTVQDR